MSQLTRINFEQLKVSCVDCSLRELCFPHGMTNAEMKQLGKIVSQRNPLRKNEALYHDGDTAQAIYAVRSGSIKTAAESINGDEQIVGFHLSGEMVGLDGFRDGTHSCTAIALETTSVCVISMDKLEQLCHVMPGLQKQMRRVMGKEISADHGMLLMLGKMSAEERLASFLLSFSRRMEERNWKADEFVLSMPRQDVANYLGLAVETVSRLFAHYQDEGLIAVDRRRISVLDMARLRLLVGEHEPKTVADAK